VNGAGDVNLKAYYGGVTLIPYFSGQNETTPGNFNLTADGDIRFAAYGGQLYDRRTVNTFTEISSRARDAFVLAARST
jgi:hypothetical protein